MRDKHNCCVKSIDDNVLVLQKRHDLAILLDDRFQVGDGLLHVDLHAAGRSRYLQVVHQLYRLQTLSSAIHALEDHVFVLLPWLFFAQQLQILHFVLEQPHLEDASQGIGEVGHEEDDDLPVIVLQIGQDDFPDGGSADLQRHLEQFVGVEFVEDHESVVFADDVDQRRFLGHLEGEDLHSFRVQLLLHLLVLQEDQPDRRADVVTS